MVFSQIATGLSYLHGKNIAHRDVALEHIVVQTGDVVDDGTPIAPVYRLIDFRSALVVDDATTSRTVLGCLPCMAPEMAIGEPYYPKLVDLWSLGVVFLEVCAGLSTLQRFVHWDDDVPVVTAGRQIMERFTRPGAHDEALGLLGAARDPSIVAKLEALLQPDPQRRVRLSVLMPQTPD